MSTEQLRSERAALQAEAEEILARSDQSISGPDRDRFDSITSRIEEIDVQLADRERRARFLASLPAAAADTGDGAAGAGRYRDVHVSRGEGQAGLLERAVHAGGAGTREGGVLLRDAARAAIDAWSSRSDVPAEWQESAERVVSGGDVHSRGVAEYVATCSTPEYEHAFRSLLAAGPAGLMGDDALEMRRVTRFLSERGMLESSVSAGQAAVPPMLDPSIVLTNTGVYAAIRGLATVKTIVTQTWKGVTSAGVSAEWTAEAAEMTDASPTFTQPSITPVRADAYVQGSWELFQDTNLATELGMLFADARARLEETAFAVGTGSTQPTGVVTALQLTTASRVDVQTNGSFGAVDIFRVDDALPARYHPGASWLAHKAWWNRTRQLGTTVNYSFWTDFGGGTPPSLIGHPVHSSSAMQSTLSAATASNDDVIILGDFKAGFYIVDRAPMVILTNPWVLGPNRRPTGETGFACFWRTGSDAVNRDAFRMLRA